MRSMKKQRGTQRTPPNKGRQWDVQPAATRQSGRPGAWRYMALVPTALLFATALSLADSLSIQPQPIELRIESCITSIQGYTKFTARSKDYDLAAPKELEESSDWKVQPLKTYRWTDDSYVPCSELPKGRRFLVLDKGNGCDFVLCSGDACSSPCENDPTWVSIYYEHQPYNN